MISFKPLRVLLWTIDPGHFRLKQAAKTVLALVIVLLLLKDEWLFNKMVACVACGFSMQGVVAKSFRYRLLHVLVFGLVYYAVFCLGLLVRDAAYWQAFLFICLGFFVNYCRRFELQGSMAPLMVWIVCYMGAVLPFDTTSEIITSQYACAIGLVVGGIVFLWVMPDNYPRLFIQNSNRIHRGLAKGLRHTQHYLSNRIEKNPFDRQSFVLIKNNLNALLESNKAMEQADLFIHKQQKISEIIIHHYGLVQAYGLMIEAYRVLKIHDYQLSIAGRLYLLKTNQDLAHFFKSLSMKTDYSITGSTTPFDEKINIPLTKEPLSEPNVVMALLNLKLSFNLFEEHLKCLLL